MKNTKIPFLFFLVITLIACGKDTPATPDENQLNYPLSFNISHYDNSGESKYYLVGDNDTYQEVVAADLYKTNFEDGVSEVIGDIFKSFEIRKLVLLTDTTVEVNYKVINSNTLEIELDTTLIVSSALDGEKISIKFYPTAEPSVLFFDEQRENLLLPGWITRGLYYFEVFGLDNLDKDFTAVADSAVINIPAQDTFAVKFIGWVFEKE